MPQAWCRAGFIMRLPAWWLSPAVVSAGLGASEMETARGQCQTSGAKGQNRHRASCEHHACPGAAWLWDGDGDMDRDGDGDMDRNRDGARRLSSCIPPSSTTSGLAQGSCVAGSGRKGPSEGTAPACRQLGCNKRRRLGLSRRRG